MCFKATCSNCHKTTWFGCGNHVPKVMDQVPHDQWCTCDPKVEKEGVQYPPGTSNRSNCQVS